MSILSFINEYITSPALVAGMTCFGAYFTARLRLFRSGGIKKGISELKRQGETTGISASSSLTVALSGTLGVGNIAGVAVAISVGGAGAVFWMMISAILGASLKYCEAYMSAKHRRTDGSGGAPVYIERTFSRGAGVVFAVLCISTSFFSGAFIQMNAASSSLRLTYGVPPLVSGVVFAIVCFAVANGGMKRVSSFTSFVTPIFCAVFAGLSVIAVSMRISEVPGVIYRIFTEAFGIRAAGGGISGVFAANAIRAGMTKGVFSHEAGCGTSSFSHAASKAPAEAQGLVGIAEVLFDTVFFAGLTALVLLLSPAGQVKDCYDGMYLSITGYSYFFGVAATHIITVMTVFFAFAASLCWGHYGCCAVNYIKGGRGGEKYYLFVYCAALILGSVISAEAVWQLSDIVCAVMLVVNCACLFKARGDILNKRTAPP